MLQLLWQLPLHDSDTQYCRELLPEEKREHLNFNTQRKRDALGRGTVRQLPVTLKSTSCSKVSNLVTQQLIRVENLLKVFGRFGFSGI